MYIYYCTEGEIQSTKKLKRGDAIALDDSGTVFRVVSVMDGNAMIIEQIIAISVKVNRNSLA